MNTNLSEPRAHNVTPAALPPVEKSRRGAAHSARPPRTGRRSKVQKSTDLPLSKLLPAEALISLHAYCTEHHRPVEDAVLSAVQRFICVESEDHDPDAPYLPLPPELRNPAPLFATMPTAGAQKFYDEVMKALNSTAFEDTIVQLQGIFALTAESSHFAVEKYAIALLLEGSRLLEESISNGAFSIERVEEERTSAYDETAYKFNPMPPLDLAALVHRFGQEPKVLPATSPAAA